MKGYIANIEKDSLKNEYFRKVLYTDDCLQLVIMSLKPNEDIGEEVHELQQFIRVEQGEGTAVLDGEESVLTDGSVVIVPHGIRHNIINTSAEHALKLYTVYTPPNHKGGTVHKTKAEADASEAQEEHTV